MSRLYFKFSSPLTVKMPGSSIFYLYNLWCNMFLSEVYFVLKTGISCLFNYWRVCNFIKVFKHLILKPGTKSAPMKKNLHYVISLLLILLITNTWFPSNLFSQTVQFGKSYINTSKPNGGTFEAGDILEIRATIA